MITEKELQEAIAECQGQRNPNANTCMKLASYYTILDHLSRKEEDQGGYSFSYQEPVSDIVRYDSGTEFSQAIYERDSNEMWGVIDELMSTLSVINPRLYSSVIRKLEG